MLTWTCGADLLSEKDIKIIYLLNHITAVSLVILPTFFH